MDFPIDAKAFKRDRYEIDTRSKGEIGHMIRKIAAIAMLAPVCLIAVACGGEESSKGSAQPPADKPPAQEGSASPTPGTSKFKLEKPATVTMLTQAKEYRDDLPILKWIKDATNITVKGSFPAGAYTDAIALTMAGGDIPDVVFMNSTSLANKYGTQGALLNINEHLDKMPNLKKFWQEHPSLRQMATTPDGKVYHVINEGLGYTNQLVWMYRADIFEKHQLKPPATWEELHKVLAELKKLYPSSFPFTFRGGTGAIEYQMSPAFGMYRDVYPDPKTGEIKFGPTQPNYKRLLEYLHAFNRDKLINPDFLSITTQQWEEMMVTGKAFMTVDYIGRIQSLTEAMKEAGAHLKFMAPPAGPGGAALNPNSDYMLGGFTVYKNAKNLNAALHYIDFLYSEEGSKLTSWGIEGESYKVVDGKKVLTSGTNSLDIRSNTGQAAFGTYGWFDSAATMSLIPERFKADFELAPKYAYYKIIEKPSFTGAEEEVMSTRYTQIQKLKDTNVAKFILGERPLSEWDAYVAEIEKLGLKQVLDIYKTGWDRQK